MHIKNKIVVFWPYLFKNNYLTLSFVSSIKTFYLGGSRNIVVFGGRTTKRKRHYHQETLSSSGMGRLSASVVRPLTNTFPCGFSRYLLVRYSTPDTSVKLEASFEYGLNQKNAVDWIAAHPGLFRFHMTFHLHCLTNLTVLQKPGKNRFLNKFFWEVPPYNKSCYICKLFCVHSWIKVSTFSFHFRRTYFQTK